MTAFNLTRHALLALVAVSPCPLATNIAAIGYVARFSQGGGAGHAWLPGLLYALGRAVAYTTVGGVITWGLLSAPALSSFLQQHMNQLLGPLLVLVGMALLATGVWMSLHLTLRVF